MDTIILPDVEGTIEREALEAIRAEDPSLDKIEFIEIEYDYEDEGDPGEERWVGHIIFTATTVFEYRGPNARVGSVDIYVEFNVERGELIIGNVHTEETDSWWA